MLKCLEYARNLATINTTLLSYQAFETFLLSKEKEIEEETKKQFVQRRVPFQKMEEELYRHLLNLSAFKATKCNVYLGVNVLKSLGYSHYINEPEAGERRYKYKFHNMIRVMRKMHSSTVPESNRNSHDPFGFDDGILNGISLITPINNDLRMFLNLLFHF